MHMSKPMHLPVIRSTHVRETTKNKSEQPTFLRLCLIQIYYPSKTSMKLLCT